MSTFLEKNFPTVAMLIGLSMVLLALVSLLWAGKVQGDSATATALVTSAGTIVGGIAGYSMHRTTDATAQGNGVQITKKETE